MTNMHQVAAGSLALTLIAAVPPEDKAAQVLASARAAIAGGRLDTLKTFSVGAQVRRVMGNFEVTSDVEILIEMPDKYARSEVSTGGPVNMSMTSGFNGDRPLLRQGSAVAGGAMVFRIGPGGPVASEKATPEQQAEASAAALRAARGEISRLMLGWFAMAHPSINPAYTYAGEAESPDGKADAIDAKGDGLAARLFIDQQSHVPLMVTYQAAQRVIATAAPYGRASADDVQKKVDELRKQQPPLVEYRLYFSDWSEMDGIRFPRKIQRASEGVTQEEWTIAKIRVNPRIDPKKFDVER